MTGSPVVTVVTVNDVTVVRWHHAAGEEPVLKAHYRNVKVRHELAHTVPQAWIDDATRAHEALAADPQADMSTWSTGA